MDTLWFYIGLGLLLLLHVIIIGAAWKFGCHQMSASEQDLEAQMRISTIDRLAEEEDLPPSYEEVMKQRY